MFLNTLEHCYKVFMACICLFANCRLCVIIFLLYLHALTLVNKIGFSCNVYILLSFNVTNLLLKMEHVVIRHSLQGNEKHHETLCSVGKPCACTFLMLHYFDETDINFSDALKQAF